MRTNTLCLCVLLAISQSAWAHDQSGHKGKPVHGTISAVSEDTLTLSTDNGPVSATLTIDTKVERAEKEAGRGALTPGAHVAVFGTKVPGQGLVAKEIVLDAKDPRAAPRGEGHEAHSH